MTANLQQVLEKLDTIKSELDFIKEHITDADRVLTEEDTVSLSKAEKDLREGKTKRLI